MRGAGEVAQRGRGEDPDAEGMLCRGRDRNGGGGATRSSEHRRGKSTLT